MEQLIFGIIPLGQARWLLLLKSEVLSEQAPWIGCGPTFNQAGTTEVCKNLIFHFQNKLDKLVKLAIFEITKFLCNWGKSAARLCQ
jgi:hypothetical protein